MAGTIAEQLHMLDYWINKKGLEEALDHYAPDVAKDSAIAAAMVQMKNAERAISARISELADENPWEFD